MIQAFGYIRVSGKSQLEGDGFPRQREAIYTYAAAAGLEIIHIYEERAIAGSTEWDDRPAWLEMLGAIIADGVDTIVIENLNRLARTLMVQEHIIADLKKRGITLISTAEPDLGSDDPTRVLMRQVLGAVAQYDRAMIVLKLRGARRRIKAQEGRCEGRKPYGFRPDEKATMARIEKWREAGITFDTIAANLNKEGVPTRYGQTWRRDTLAKMFRNR